MTSPRRSRSSSQPCSRGRVYHYKFDALNKFGATSTTDHVFKTAGNPPPDVATGGADILSDNAATVTAIINPHGQATRYYFQYGPQDAPTANDVTTPVQTLASKTQPASFRRISPV